MTSLSISVLREYYGELHRVLTFFPVTLESLTIRCYQWHIIDFDWKLDINQSEGRVGARTLLDGLILKVEQSYEHLHIIIEAMKFEEPLVEIVRKMELNSSASTSPDIGQKIPAILADKNPYLPNLSVEEAAAEAQKLKRAFISLTLSVMNAATAMNISVAHVKTMISHFYQTNMCNTSPKIQAILVDMENVTTTDGAIRFMINKNLICYLTFKIFEYVFSNLFSDNHKAIKDIDSYAQQRKNFINATPLKAFASVFKQYPDLRPAKPADDLPFVKFVLDESWENRSLYQWNEVMADVMIIPDHLMITDIETNCITISCIILPFFLSTVLKQLTDESVIKALKNVGVSFNTDEALMRMGSLELKHISITLKHAEEFVQRCTQISGSVEGSMPVNDKQKHPRERVQRQASESSTLTVSNENSMSHGTSGNDITHDPDNSLVAFLRMEVPILPMQLTVTGLPSCGKTDIIRKLFKLSLPHPKKDTDDKTFFNHNVVSGVGDTVDYIHTKEESENFIYGLLSGCLFNGYDMAQIDSMDLTDENIGSFYKKVFDNLKIEYNDPIGPGKIEKKLLVGTDLTLGKALLRHGITFLNVWNIPISSHLRPVLESFSQLLTRNFMLVFASLDRDLDRLHYPPQFDIIGDDDQHLDINSNPLRWRSRCEYLLRSCQMALHSVAHGEKKVCKIVASYKSQFDDEQLKKAIKKMSQECQNMAFQFGLDNVVDSNVLPVNFNDAEKETNIQNQVGIFRHSIGSMKVPMSWLFLRGYLYEQDSFYIMGDNLVRLAKIFDDINIKDFCAFFGSFGSILDVRVIDPSSNYIIINPVSFLSKVDDIYRNAEESTNGVLSKTEGDNQIILEILTSLGLSVALPNDAKYYLPSLRKNGKQNTSCSEDAVRLVLDIKSPQIHIATGLMKQLMRENRVIHPEIDLQLELNAQFINRVHFKSKTFGGGVILTFQGYVVEIELLDKDNEKNPDFVAIVIDACKQTIEDQSRIFEKTGVVSYHFAFRCRSDAVPNHVSMNIHRELHILPITAIVMDFCQDCSSAITEQQQEMITIWSRLLTKPEHMILKKHEIDIDLSSEIIAEIAKRISSCRGYRGIELFAEALDLSEAINLKSLKENQNNESFKKWLVLDLLVKWNSKLMKNAKGKSMSPKKILARKILPLEDKWPLHAEMYQEQPPFKLLARKLDVTIFTKEDRKKLAKFYDPILSTAEDKAEKMHVGNTNNSMPNILAQVN